MKLLLSELAFLLIVVMTRKGPSSEFASRIKMEFGRFSIIALVMSFMLNFCQQHEHPLMFTSLMNFEVAKSFVSSSKQISLKTSFSSLSLFIRPYSDFSIFCKFFQMNLVRYFRSSLKADVLFNLSA